MKAEKNPQRYRNYWEPIYNPAIKQFNIWNSDIAVLDQTTGIKEVSFNIEECKNIKSNRLIEKKFENVDFWGKLDGGQRKFTFLNCSFNYCSFRETTFINVKFKNCKFDHTTFTFGKFVNCEFRECSFTKLGISSNATYLDNIYVDPISFIKDFYLMENKAILKENNSNFLLQWYMLERTKSTIARKLVDMPSIQKNINFLINGIKESRKHEILSWIKESIYFIIKGSMRQKIRYLVNLIYSSLEFLTIMFFGWLSGWGHKIGKTLVIGLISLIFLSILNHDFVFTNDTIISSILKTLEYWFLFGYTKYSFTKIPETHQWIIFGNTILGLIWFAALIPIIINKLGKNDD